MSVKIVPVQHQEVDYVELSAALQAQLNECEAETNRRLNEQAAKYEATIRELNNEVC
jgi:hypothetical protein